jgi:VWFA-related protein
MRPDSGTIRLFGVLGLLSALAAPLHGAQQRYEDRAEVTLITVDVRAVDAAGRPIPGLGPQDFRVRVDGKEVPLQSVEWVPAAGLDGAAAEAGAGGPGAAAEAGDLDAAPAEAGLTPGGRTIVLFFQADFQRHRVAGHLRMARRAVRFLDTLAPEDQVAVLSFDSHLKLRADFTRDRGALTEAIRRSILYGPAPHLEPGPELSLSRHLDRGEAKDAATPEKALLLTGQALERLPGPKVLVLFGWGLGRLSTAGVQMLRDYDPARKALAAARTTVFSLDVSNADYHSLEVGLQKIADETGGFYARTHLFPALVMNRLQRTIAGHYVLSFARPPGPAGTHRLRVRLEGRKGEVLAKEFYTD